MRRRRFLRSVASVAGLSAGGALFGLRAAQTATPMRRDRVRPGDPDWPNDAAWDRLRAEVGGRLIPVTSPLDDCASGPDGGLCESALKDLQNPYYIQDQAGGTQSAGWADGWTSAPSVYAVEPAGPADVAAAVNFARENNLRLVVKGGAHSYLGQSNSVDSLMIWTRRMDAIALHDAFTPQGCDGIAAPRAAVSVGSGARFVQLYDLVTTQHGRYVQGGGCASVGVGGHVQTGGFGSFSKYGGLVAASLLEAEIVTADGVVRTANACAHPDLFQALKGGGAGFGVTTRLTLATRPLPDRFGFLGRTIVAASDDGFRRLIDAFCRFVPDALINPHWGEQVTFGPDNSLTLAMVFQGLSDNEADAAWAPLWDWLAANPDDIAELSEKRLVSAPARHWWDPVYRQEHRPDSIIMDDRPDAPPGRFWWAGNSNEVGIFISDYQSAWLPENLLAANNRDRLVAALFSASRHFATTLHFNKGLAGATPERREEARAAMVHPGMVDAFALAVVVGGQLQKYPGVVGHEPDMAAARHDAGKIADALAELRSVAPDAGSYSSEMSYFEPNWRQVSWGPHYPALLATKQKYDPDALFTGHHQVGSEVWSADGFSRLN